MPAVFTHSSSPDLVGGGGSDKRKVNINPEATPGLGSAQHREAKTPDSTEPSAVISVSCELSLMGDYSLTGISR